MPKEQNTILTIKTARANLTAAEQFEIDRELITELLAAEDTSKEDVNYGKIIELVNRGAHWGEILFKGKILNNFEFVKLLHDISPYVFSEALKVKGAGFENTPLFAACSNDKSENKDVIRFLVEKGADFTVINSKSYSILEFLSIAHDLEFLKFLYETKPTEFLSQLNRKGVTQKTLLLNSVNEQTGRKLDPEIIKFLIEVGADITIDSYGSTILHEWTILNDLELLTWLYEKKPAEFILLLDKINNRGSTPLLKLCNFDLKMNDDQKQKINFECIKFLIAKGASLDPEGPYADTLLHHPIIYTNLEFLNWLFEFKPEECKNIINKNGGFNKNSPLAIANQVSVEAVMFLIAHGADFTSSSLMSRNLCKDNPTDIGFLSKVGCGQIFKDPDSMLQLRNTNPQGFDKILPITYKEDKSYYTILQQAAIAGYKGTVEFLLNYQGLDFRYDNGDTIFHQDVAVLIGREEIHNLLMQNPQKFSETIEVEDSNKETPLMKVVKRLNSSFAMVNRDKYIDDRTETIKLLLKFGALIPHIKDTKITSNEYYINITKKLFAAAQFADNILSKSKTLGLISREDEIANIAANFELIADRVKNKWENGDQDPELSIHISHNPFIPQELKLMLLASPISNLEASTLSASEAEEIADVLPSTAICDEDQSPRFDTHPALTLSPELSLSQFVTKSAWARREAAVKAFGAKWHDILAERAANARAAAEEIEKEDDEMDGSGEIPASAASSTNASIDSDSSVPIIDPTMHFAPVCLGTNSLEVSPNVS